MEVYESRPLFEVVSLRDVEMRIMQGLDPSNIENILGTLFSASRSFKQKSIYIFDKDETRPIQAFCLPPITCQI